MDKLSAILAASRAHYAPLRKQANPGFYDAVQQANSQELRSQALRNAKMLALVGLGTGVAGRGALGLMQLVRRNIKKPPESSPSPIPVDLPIEKKEKQSGVTDFLKGDYAQTVSGVPWAIPAGIGAAGAGAVGGWKLLDYLLDKRRKGDLDTEMSKAKKEYESALSESAAGKMASDEDSLRGDLDKLYDEVEKRADYWSNQAGRIAGLYGLGATVSGLAAASMAYNYGKGHQRKTVIEKALAERRRRRYASQPTPIYVRPHLVEPKADKKEPVEA